jgi:hypothetical protein
LSVLAFRYANVLLMLLRALPEAALRLHEEFGEEIKYILWDEEVSAFRQKWGGDTSPSPKRVSC